VNNQEVANALFASAEKWAKEQGMEIIHGPLGFNDLDREGLLIEGFDQPQTFEEQYNYPYYQTLIENYGFVKEKDWLEFKIFIPEKVDERIERLSNAVLKRYNLKLVTAKSKNQFIKQYKKQIFEVLDEAYGSLHGVVPFTDKLRDQIISQFKLFIRKEFIIVITDASDNVVAFGFAIPSLSEAVRKSKGRITLPALFRVIHAVKKPKIVDFALVGVKSDYQGKGLTAVIMKYLIEEINRMGVEYCETNLNLEDNLKIQQTWKNFEHEQHKRRRCFVKNIE
jgi:GNAT superfamily N-acetyltransferase